MHKLKSRCRWDWKRSRGWDLCEEETKGHRWFRLIYLPRQTSLPASTLIHCHGSRETLPWSQPRIRHTPRTQRRSISKKKIPCKSAVDLRDSSIRHAAPFCHWLIPTAASGCKAAAEEGPGIKLIILVICRVKKKKKAGAANNLGERDEWKVWFTWRGELLWTSMSSF